MSDKSSPFYVTDKSRLDFLIDAKLIEREPIFCQNFEQSTRFANALEVARQTATKYAEKRGYCAFESQVREGGRRFASVDVNFFDFNHAI